MNDDLNNKLRALRLPRLADHWDDDLKEAVAKQEAAEREIASEYRYAVYPLDHERHRCYTCGGPTFKYHKCRGCRGEL